MAKHYAPKRKNSTPAGGNVWPLVLVIVAAVAVAAAVFLLPMGQVPWLKPADEPVAATTTTTTTTETTTTTVKTTTTTKVTEGTKTANADGLYIDANGMLQFPTDGRYVQADSYADGKAVPWNLRLVNDWNPLPDGYEDKVDYQQVHLYYRRLDSLEVDSRMNEALSAMMKAGRDAGVKDLAVQSAHRTVSTQKRLYWNEVQEHRANYSDDIKVQQSAGTVVKRPGYSEHHLGLAVDLGGNCNFSLNQNFENTEAFKWLSEHCHEYGFILRFPKDKEDITGVIYEPWHYRYVGVEAATAIMQGGLCLEEYLEQTKQ